MKSHPSFVPHCSSVELFQFNEEGEISRTPGILMKYLSQSMAVAVPARECTNRDHSSTPTLLLTGP